MGVADSARLGVHGTSYGGYATNLLVTQTNRFKAAINISGKVDIISFYTDSPRLGVRNITAAERQQDRIGATLWQQPQKYVAHSAIMFADRIKTPMLLITGEQDSNVPADNTREMYYALRRLGKEVDVGELHERRPRRRQRHRRRFPRHVQADGRVLRLEVEEDRHNENRERWRKIALST